MNVELYSLAWGDKHVVCATEIYPTQAERDDRLRGLIFEYLPEDDAKEAEGIEDVSELFTFAAEHCDASNAWFHPDVHVVDCSTAAQHQ